MELMIFLQANQTNGILNLVIMAAAVLVTYFFFMRPQIKKQKEAVKFSEDIKVGNEVVTAGGMIGKVLKIEDKSVLLNTGDTKIKVIKSSISKDLTDQFHGKSDKK